MHRNTRIAAVATLFALLAGAWLLSATAEAQDKGFVGKNVVVILAHGPVASEVIEDLTGTVSSMDAMGLTLKSEKRNIVSGSSRRGSEYKATLFVPWGAILYVKQLQ